MNYLATIWTIAIGESASKPEIQSKTRMIAPTDRTFEMFGFKLQHLQAAAKLRQVSDSESKKRGVGYLPAAFGGFEQEKWMICGNRLQIDKCF